MKKSTKSHKRLRLSKQTLRQITDDQLRAVAGGTPTLGGGCMTFGTSCC